MAGLRGLLEKEKNMIIHSLISTNNCGKQNQKISFQGILDIHNRPTISAGMGPDRLEDKDNFLTAAQKKMRSKL